MFLSPGLVNGLWLSATLLAVIEEPDRLSGKREVRVEKE